MLMVSRSRGATPQNWREQVLDESLVEVDEAHRQHGGADVYAGDGCAVQPQSRQAGWVALRDVAVQMEGIEARHQRRRHVRRPLQVHPTGDALRRRALAIRERSQQLEPRPIERSVVEDSVPRIRGGCFPQAHWRIQRTQDVVVAVGHGRHRRLGSADALLLDTRSRHSNETSKMDGQSLPVR